MADTDNLAKSSVGKEGASAKAVGAPRPPFKRRLVFLVVSLVVLVVAIGGAWFVWHKHKKPNTPPLTGQAAVDAAIEQGNQGNTNAALNTLNTAINSTTDNAQKSALYLQQGDTYENAQNYQAALTSYQKAAQYGGLTYNLAQAIAQAAQQAGNKQVAIEYYQKAITLIPANDPTGAAEKQGFEGAIKSLQGQ